MGLFKKMTSVVDDAVKDVDDAIDDGSKAAKKTIEKTAEEVWNTTTDVAGDMVNAVLDISEQTGLTDAAKQLGAEALDILKTFKDIAEAILDSAFMAALEAFLNQILDDYMQPIQSIQNALSELTEQALEALTRVIEDALNQTGAGDVVKEQIVDQTDSTPIENAVKQLSGWGFKTVNFGLVTDAGAVGASAGIAADRSELEEAHNRQRHPTDVRMGLYAGIGVSVAGAKGSTTGGFELGAARDDISDYAGDAYGAGMSLSLNAGLGITLYVNTRLDKFLGFGIAPLAGTGAELAVDEGRTEIIML